MTIIYLAVNNEGSNKSDYFPNPRELLPWRFNRGGKKSILRFLSILPRTILSRFRKVHNRFLIKKIKNLIFFFFFFLHIHFVLKCKLHRLLHCSLKVIIVT